MVTLVVAVAFMYRDYLRRDKLETLQVEIDALDQRREAGDLSDEEHRDAKQRLLDDLIP